MITPKIRTPRGRLSHLQAAAGVDAWTTRERISLIETVMKCGTEDWNEVSKAMHEITKSTRSKEWCSPTSCTREFQVAVEFAGKIVRKQGVAGGGGDFLSHIRNYYVGERLKELKNLEEEHHSKYTNLFKFNQEIAAGQHDEKVDALITAYEGEGISLPNTDDGIEPNYSEIADLAEISDRMSIIQSIINKVIGRTIQPISLAQDESMDNESESGKQGEQTPADLTGITEEDDDIRELMGILPGIENFDGVDYDTSAMMDTSEFDVSSPPESSASSRKVATAPSPKASPQLKHVVRSAIATTPKEEERSRTAQAPSGAPTLSLLLGMPPRDPGQPLPEIESVAKAAESISSALQASSPTKVGYSTPPHASPSNRDSPSKLSSSPTLQRLLEGTMYAKRDSGEGKALEELAVEAIVSGAAEIADGKSEVKDVVKSPAKSNSEGSMYTASVVVKSSITEEEPMDTTEEPVSVVAEISSTKSDSSALESDARSRSPSKRLEAKAVSEPKTAAAISASPLKEKKPAEVRTPSKSSPVKAASPQKAVTPMKLATPVKAGSPTKSSPTPVEVKIENLEELEAKTNEILEEEITAAVKKSSSIETLLPECMESSTKEAKEVIEKVAAEAKPDSIEQPSTTSDEIKDEPQSRDSNAGEVLLESEDEMISHKPVLIPSRTYSRKERFGAEAIEDEEESSSSEYDVPAATKVETQGRLSSPLRTSKSPVIPGSPSPTKRGRKSRKETSNETSDAGEEETRITRATRSHPVSTPKQPSSKASTPKPEETEASKEVTKATRATRSRSSIAVTPAPAATTSSELKTPTPVAPTPSRKSQVSVSEADKEIVSSPDLDSMFGAGRPLRGRMPSATKVLDSLPSAPMESNPSSPSSTTTTSTNMDDDKEQRAFKKSISFLWEQIKSHKHAGQFLKPITDVAVPKYSTKVYEPMDLTTIKRNIDGGKIQTIQRFERDIYLMLMNAIMYNSADHEIHQRTLEMELDVRNLIESYKATQKALKNNTSQIGDTLGHGTDSTARSPVKLRSSIRRSKKSESDWDDTHDEFASGEHTPLSLTDAEFDDVDSEKHGHKTRESSPDITLGGSLPKQRSHRSGTRRLTDRTSSTEGAQPSPDVVSSAQGSRILDH